MNKVLKKLATLLLAALVAALSANAGKDIASAYKTRKAEARVSEVMNGLPGVTVEVRKCYSVPDKGWLCDIEMKEVGGEGRHMRGAKLFTFEDLQ